MNLFERIPKKVLRIIVMCVAFALIFGSMFVFYAADEGGAEGEVPQQTEQSEGESGEPGTPDNNEGENGTETGTPGSNEGGNGTETGTPVNNEGENGEPGTPGSNEGENGTETGTPGSNEGTGGETGSNEGTGGETGNAPEGVAHDEGTHAICQYCDKCKTEGCNYVDGVCKSLCHECKTTCLCEFCGGKICSGDCYESSDGGTTWVKKEYDHPCASLAYGVPDGCHEHVEADCACGFCHGCGCDPGTCWQPNPGADPSAPVTYTACSKIAEDTEAELCPGGCHEHDAAKCSCSYCGGKVCKGNCYDADGDPCTPCAKICSGCHEHTAGCLCPICHGKVCTGDCYDADGDPCALCTTNCPGKCHVHKNSCGTCITCDGCLGMCDGNCYVASPDPDDPNHFIITGPCKPCTCSNEPYEPTFDAIRCWGGERRVSESELAEFVSQKGSWDIDIRAFCRLYDTVGECYAEYDELSKCSSLIIVADATPLNKKYNSYSISQPQNENQPPNEPTFTLPFTFLEGGKAGSELKVTGTITAVYKGTELTTTFEYLVKIYNSAELSELTVRKYDPLLTADSPAGTALLGLGGGVSGTPTVSAVWLAGMDEELPVNCTYDSANKTITVNYSLDDLGLDPQFSGELDIRVTAAINNSVVSTTFRVRIAGEGSCINQVTTSDGYERYIVRKGETKEIVLNIEYAKDYHGGANCTVSSFDGTIIGIEEKPQEDNKKLVLKVTGIKVGEAEFTVTVSDNGVPPTDTINKTITIIVPEESASENGDACIIFDPSSTVGVGKDFTIIAKGWFTGSDSLESATVCYIPESWQINPSGKWDWNYGEDIRLNRSASVSGLSKGEYTATVAFRRYERGSASDSWNDTDTFAVRTRKLTVTNSSTGGGKTTQNPATADGTTTSILAVAMLVTGLAMLAVLGREKLVGFFRRKARLLNTVRR